MGEIIMKKIKGMNWKSRTGLLLGLTLVFTICIYQLHGAKSLEAGATTPITACTDCHNTPLDSATRDATTGRFPGSHNTHGNAPYSYDCSVCHVKPAANAWGHRDGNINMINPLNSDAGAAYSKGTAFPQTNTPEPFGSCSNTYCHGNYSGGFNASPVWGGAANCGSCHNTVSPSRLSHPRHSGLGAGQMGLACTKCHPARDLKDGHVNASVQWDLDRTDIKFGSNAAYRGLEFGGTGAKASSIAYGNCSSIYCHSTGQSATGGAAPTYATPAWGGAALNCGSCHADMAGASGTGSHITHANSYAMACDNCHTGYTSGSTNSAQHVNVNIEVALSATYGGAYSGGTTPGNHAPGGGFGNCSTNYCHSTGEAIPTYATPIWGNAASGACGTCHGATKASTPVTYAHEIHAKADRIYQFRCYKCHKNTVTNADPAAISSTVLHVNKTRDVNLDISDPLIGSGATYDSGSVSCSTLYCHSTGKADVVPADQLPVQYGGSHYTSADWDGAAGCAFCHGKSQTGYPDYTMANQELDKGTARANSHLVTGSPTSHKNTSCAVCHWTTTIDGATIFSNSHVNKAIDVNFPESYNLGGTATYNPDRSCSNVSCHGVQSAVWGAKGSCTDCHEAGAINISGVHNRHWEEAAGNATALVTGNSSDAAYYKFQCNTCHSGATHPDGVIGQNFADVGFNITWALGYETSGIYTPNTGNQNDTTDSRWQKISTDGSCSSIYCHSSGIAPGAAGPTYADIAWNATPQVPSCGVCHGAPPATNRHTVHAATYAIGCVECHQATVSSNTIIADKFKHVNAINEVAWKTGGFNIDGSAYETGGADACSNIYCHSQGKASAEPYDGTGNAPNTAAVWTGGTTTECAACHSGDAAAASKMSTNRHAAHMDNAAVIGVNYSCDICHSATVAAGQNRTISSTANHVNKQVNVAFTALNTGASYDGSAAPMTKTPGSAAGNCTNLYCHSNGKIGTFVGDYANRAWNGAGIGCNGCHGRTTSVGHPDYASGAAGSATANSHAKHAGTVGYNCSACHYSVTTNGTAINGASPLLHINANVQDVSFASAYGGSYTGGTKTCSTNYCHSNAQGASGVGAPSSYASPVWGGTALDCASCHKDFSALAENSQDLSLGSHKRHTVDTEYDCSLCHAGFTANSVSYPAHADGIINVSFTGKAAQGPVTYYSQQINLPGDGYGTCSTSVCHGRATRNWGISTTTPLCAKCHGSAASSAPGVESVPGGFRDTSGSTGSAFSGTHFSHIIKGTNSDPMTCDECHVEPAAIDSAGHMSGLPAGLTWGALTRGAIRDPLNPSHTPVYSGAPSRTCSSTYCHSQGGLKPSPTWGDLGYDLNCGNCHGNPPAYPHPSGDEGKNCIGCHYHVASSNTAFKDSYLLIEGICSKRTYTTQATCETNGGTWTPPGQTVPGKSLHIDGINQVTKDECLGCHSNTGDFALLGQHEIHTDNDYFLSRLVAGTAGTATGGSPTTVVDSTKNWTANVYKDKYVRITSGANKNQQIMIAGNTSNTITVTGSGFTNAVANGMTYEIRSAKLLSNDDYDDPGWLYEIYYADGFPKYACGFCHPDNSAIHRDGIVNLDMDPTHSLPGTVKTKNDPAGPWFAQTVSGSEVTCLTVYCHSNGYISPITEKYQYKTTANWYAADPWAGRDRCAQCHGNSPNTGGTAGSPAHAGHVVGNHYKDVFSGTAGKLARAGGVGSGAVHGDQNTSTVFNCNICHYTTVKVSYNDKETVCVTCHTTSGSGGLKGTMVVDPVSINHIDGNINVDFTPVALKSKAQVRDDITSVNELNTSWTRMNLYKKTDGTSHDVAKTTPTYSAGSCLTVACHNGTPMEWRAQGPLPCAACHKGLPQ